MFVSRALGISVYLEPGFAFADLFSFYPTDAFRGFVVVGCLMGAADLVTLDAVIGCDGLRTAGPLMPSLNSSSGREATLCLGGRVAIGGFRCILDSTI